MGILDKNNLFQLAADLWRCTVKVIRLYGDGSSKFAQQFDARLVGAGKKAPVVHLTRFQNGMIFPLVSEAIAGPTGLPTRVLRSRHSDSTKHVLLGVMQDAEAVYRALAVAGKCVLGRTRFSFPEMTTFHNIVGENSSLAKVWKSATTKQDDLSFGSDDGTTFR